MSDWAEKVQAWGGDMDAPERIWAYNSLQTGYRFTANGPQPHFDGVEYIRADLMAELVEAAEGIAPLVDCDEPREPDGDSIGWQNGNEPIPVTFGQVRAFFAALAKIKEQTK